MQRNCSSSSDTLLQGPTKGPGEAKKCSEIVATLQKCKETVVAAVTHFCRARQGGLERARSTPFSKGQARKQDRHLSPKGKRAIKIDTNLQSKASAQARLAHFFEATMREAI